MWSVPGDFDSQMTFTKVLDGQKSKFSAAIKDAIKEETKEPSGSYSHAAAVEKAVHKRMKLASKVNIVDLSRDDDKPSNVTPNSGSKLAVGGNHISATVSQSKEATFER